MIRRVLKTMSSYLSFLDEHTIEVLNKSIASTFVKVAGLIVGLFLSVFLGRTLGADGLGIINLTNRIVYMLAVIILLGMKDVVVKEIAIAFNKKNYRHIGRVMQTAYWINGVFALIITIPLILLAPWLSVSIFNEPRLTFPLVISLLSLVPYVFSYLFSSALVGAKKIWQSNLVDQTLSILVTTLLLVILWLAKHDISINVVAICYAVGKVFVTIAIGWYWGRVYRYNTKADFIPRPLIRVSIPLFLSTSAAIVITNVDAIFLAGLSNTADVGLYTVAVRIAFLTSFFLQVTNASVSPKIASLYEEGRINELEKMIQRVTTGLLVVGAIPVVILLLFGNYILQLWGSEFADAHVILIILSAGQLFNIGTGAVAQLLIMTGHRRENTLVTVGFMMLNLLLNYTLISLYGIVGAAIAYSFTIAGLNVVRVFIAKRKIGVLTIPVNWK